MSHWELSDLRVFAAVAQAGSMRAASDLVALSVPAISAKIKSLESALGVSLLERHHSGIALTPAGRRLLAHAQDMLEQASLIDEDIGEFGSAPKGVVKLAANTTAVTEYLPQLLAHFMADHPRIDVALSELVSHEVVQQVRNGQADIGIFTPGPATDDLHTLAFRRDRLCLIVSKRHVWAGRSDMDFSESLIADHVCLQKTAALYRYLMRKAKETGRSLRGRIHVTSFDAIAHMVASGVGVSVMPSSAAHRLSGLHELSIVRLRDVWADNELHLCLRDPEALSSSTRLLLTHLQHSASPLAT